MPAPRFFEMRRQGLYLEALEKSELCDIQAISICELAHYNTMKDYFKKTIDQFSGEAGKSQVQRPALEIGSHEAKDAMMSLFQAGRRS